MTFRSIAPRRATFAALVVLLALAPVAPARARPPLPGCGVRAAELREALEPVVEAALDHQGARTVPAVARAAEWWKLHRRAFAAPAPGDSAFARLVAARGTLPAARAAVEAATASFAWCDDRLRTSDRLMQLDLLGMTGWLRTQGEDVPVPSFANESVAFVAAALEHRGAKRLAAVVRREGAAASALPATRGPASAARSATDLLERVDDAERVLR